MQPPPLNASKRFHDLDALRAFAMLLGIFLHAFLGFIKTDYWPVQDVSQPVWKMPGFLIATFSGLPETFSPYEFLVNAVHGFRMQLFFLVSGFFTAMLWKKRGLKSLFKHRAKRILLPLIIGTIIMWPLVIVSVILASPSKSSSTIWAAAKSGDVAAVEQFLEDGADPNQLDSGSGITALTWAACTGELQVVELLLENGAEHDQRDRDGGTPLHAAAFFGHNEVAGLLLERDANPLTRNNDGLLASEVMQSDFGVVKFIASLLKIEVDQDDVMAGREKIAPLLEAAEEKARSAEGFIPKSEKPTDSQSFLTSAGSIYAKGAITPVFFHLWFLYYLLWMVVLFAIAVAFDRKTGGRYRPKVLWLVPLAVIPQIFMVYNFGPDTAPGLLIWPAKLAYYAIFFAVGVLFYTRPDFGDKLQKRWAVLLGSAAPVLLISLFFYNLRDLQFERGFAENHTAVISAQIAYSIFAVTYAWLMVFGMIGLFRRFFPAENPKVRYISDASYWLYLAHLPIIFLLQIVVSEWDFPSFPKLILICLVTVSSLLFIYQIAVRYTFIGTMLNGKKNATSRLNRVESLTQQ